MSETFEETKQSLLEVEKKIAKKSHIVRETILNASKRIPYIGGLIDIVDSIDSHNLSDFQQKKRDNLLNIITSNTEMITSDMVTDVEFILNFVKTLDAVNRLARNDKVKYFANLLKNGYLSNNRIESNDFDEYFQILTELSYRQIKYLCLYNECKKETGITDRVLTDADKIVNKFKEKLKEEDVEIDRIIDSIQRTVFMREMTGTYLDYEGGDYYLTDEFDDFAKWITDVYGE